MHGIMLWDEDDSRLLSESNQVTGVTPLGVTLVFLSALASCWGVFLQKIAQIRRLLLEAEYQNWTEDERELPENMKIYHRRVHVAVAIWCAGLTLLIVVSFPLDTIAMNLMGQAMVMPMLAGLQVAFNQILAPYVFGEEFNKVYDGTATVVILVGVLFTTLFGPGSPFGSAPALPMPTNYQTLKNTLGERISHPGFIVFEVLLLLLLAFCLYHYKSESGCTAQYSYFMVRCPAGCPAVCKTRAP